MLGSDEETGCYEAFGGREDFNVAEEEIIDWTVWFHAGPDSFDGLKFRAFFITVFHVQGEALRSPELLVNWWKKIGVDDVAHDRAELTLFVKLHHRAGKIKVLCKDIRS